MIALKILAILVALYLLITGGIGTLGYVFRAEKKKTPMYFFLAGIGLLIITAFI